MFCIPPLEYGLTHPHPKGQLFLVVTVVIFLPMLPLLVLISLATVGSELVPSLQPRFQPNGTLLAGWWGSGRLPSLLRPKAPSCEPKDLGRGDTFRVSGSLFDYKVMSTWSTSEPLSASRIQEQKRVEYRDESFASCYVNNTRFDYSMTEETQTMTVGVICPGSDDYPIFVSMETEIVFALELTKDFIGQYYGPGLNLLSIEDASSSDYRKLVLAVLEVISTDSLAIVGGDHLSQPLLSLSMFFFVNNRTEELYPVTSTVTYLNGTKLRWTAEANAYWLSVTNLMHVVNHAVNLDLGSQLSPNLFRNASVLKKVVAPNLAPSGINPASWVASGTQSFYYDNLPAQYETWAEALLAGHPVQVGNATNLPLDSTMVTTYLCPMYQIKPASSLLSSVFIGTATMFMSVWGAWMALTAYVARKIIEPRVQCHCEACIKSGLVTNPAVANAEDPEPNLVPGSGSNVLFPRPVDLSDITPLSYTRKSTEGE